MRGKKGGEIEQDRRERTVRVIKCYFELGTGTFTFRSVLNIYAS